MLKLKDIHKSYQQGSQEFPILKGIDLHVKEGDFLAIMGPSGSGKSTLMNIIGCLDKASSGTYHIEGTDVSELSDNQLSDLRNQKIGFVFQNFNLIEGLSVYENLLAPFALTNFKANVREEMIKRALELANIAHKRDENVSNLSGGERQRCAVARALSMDADIILADEPTANLDRDNARAFLGLLESFKALKKSVIVATHDSIFDELGATDRALILQNGEIV